MNPVAAPDSTASARNRPEPRCFLIRGPDENRRGLDGCPNAMTYVTIAERGDQPLYTELRCKQWGCTWCGRRRIYALAIRCELAAPTKFITLTTRFSNAQTPRQVYDQTRRQVSQLAKAIRLRGTEFEYLRILEIHKNGNPHYHLIARCDYVPQ